MSRTRRTLLGLAGLVLVALFLPAAWWRGVLQAGSGLPDAPYRVVDTGYWPYDSFKPLWLDNERLLFASTATLRPGRPPHRVQVLDTRTGERVATDLSGYICARHGQLMYGVRDEASGAVTYYRGPLGHAKEHPNPDGSASMNPADHTMRIDARFDCDWVPRETYGAPLWHSTGRYKLLGDDYIDAVEARTARAEHQRKIASKRIGRKIPASGAKGRYLYRPLAGVERELPTLFWWDYSEFLDAYVSSGYYDPTDPETRSFWILRRDGDLKEIPYPPDMLIGRTDVYPVRVGYVVHYTGGSLAEKKPITETSDGDRGLYLIQGDRVQRLIIGTFGLAISPDGCKVALAHAKSIKEDLSLQKPHRTVKYIDFCEGGAP